MRLPNVENAYIDLRKLTEYAVDTTNVRGQHKARVMEAALGLTAENAQELRALILAAVLENDCTLGELDFYGQRYSVDCKIKTEKGEAVVRSNWIIRRSENFPRLTTCFVRKRRTND